MRSFVHSSLFGLVAVGAALLGSPAYAQDGGTPEGGTTDGGTTDGGTSDGGVGLPACDPTTLLCSNGLIGSGHKKESTARLPTDIQTGWLPACSSNPPHCDKSIQVEAQIALDPPKTGGPIWSVDMTKDSFVDLRWDPSNVDTFTVSLEKGKPNPAAGKFTVSHTLTPEFGIYVSVPGIYTGEFTVDSSVLVNYLPGAQFNYYATGSQKFPPWGFDLVQNEVKGTDLANSQLFAVTFDQIAGWMGVNVSDYASGQFAFDATTDSKFTYQTTKVVVTGATSPIGYQAGTTEYPINDGDYVELQTHAEGVIRYTGTIDLKFVIGVTSVAGIGMNLNFPIDVYSIDYGSGDIPVVFPIQVVHIPIPNVFVPSTPLDFGTVQTGAKSNDKTVTIENTGELGAILSFTSDSNQFSINSQSTTMGPDGETYDLKVAFKPTKSGVQTGTITVNSNDPDSPVQTIEVRGIGEGPDLPGADDGGTGGSSGGNDAGLAGTVYSPSASNDGGCGCTTAPVRYGNAAAGLALAGLGLALLRRKRS